MKHSFRQGRVLTLLLLLAVPLLGVIANSAISSTARAAASGYVFVYDARKAGAIKKEIQSTSSVSVGSLANTPNLNATMVRAAGGELNSGDKTTDLKFSSSKVNGAYLFKTKLTCTISGSAIKTYVDIELPLGTNFASKKSYSAKQTVISYLTDSNYNEDTGVTARLPDGDGYGKEQSSGCFSQSTTSAPKSINIKNFQKLSSSEKDDWRDAASNTTDRGELSPGATSEGDIPCIGGAMGWIFCPIINYMADGIVAVSGFIDDMMQFKLLIGAQSGNGIRETLNNFAGIANIMLVIAFLVIIFSQSTSIGLSNYNIKKMLPRIVIAAILINLSFYICAFAIDISNIAGNSIMGLVAGQGVGNASVGQGIQSATGLSGPNSAQKVFGAAFGVVTGVILLIMFMGPLLLGIFLTFVILVARQVILLFLVITAPLAFAAWLLPNTESYFKKWKDLFINMLMIYPIVMLIFGVSLFAAKFISDPSIQNSSNSGALGGAAIGPIIVLLVLAIPLLALPFILKQSSSMLAKVGNAAQKYGGGQVSGMLGGKSREFGKNAALNAKTRAAFTSSSLYQRGLESDRFGTGALNWAQQKRRGRQAGHKAREIAINARKQEREEAIRGMAGDAITGSDAFARVGGDRVHAYARAEESKSQKEAIDRVQATWRLDGTAPQEIAKALQAALLSGDHTTTQAAIGSLSQMGGFGNEQLQQTLANTPVTDPTTRQKVENAINDPSNFGSIASSSGDVVKGKWQSNGTFAGNHAELGTEQIATQSASSLERWRKDLYGGQASQGDISKAKAEALRILGNEQLTAKVKDTAALEELQRISRL